MPEKLAIGVGSSTVCEGEKFLDGIYLNWDYSRSASAKAELKTVITSPRKDAMAYCNGKCVVVATGNTGYDTVFERK
jgi:hypothetical protein